MKIVVIDGYPMNPGDLDWDALQKLGDVTVYDRSAEDQVLDRCKDAQIIINNKIFFDKELLDALPKLHMIALSSTGVNVVDMDAAKANNVAVTNVPSYSTDSVAQLVFSYILHAAFQVSDYSERVKEGKWASSPDFTFYNKLPFELAGKKIGIIGYGHIGRKVSEIATAFGMKVLVYTRRHLENCGSLLQVDMETLFRESDFVTIHCPLTTETDKLINKENLSLMQETAYLINTSRGGVVDEYALAEVLMHKKIAGAYLDVLCEEPPQNDNILVASETCIITPHIAWATQEARKRLLSVVVKNISAFIKGKELNRII